jgi:hypothetical protein
VFNGLLLCTVPIKIKDFSLIHVFIRKDRLVAYSCLCVVCPFLLRLSPLVIIEAVDRFS